MTTETPGRQKTSRLLLIGALILSMSITIGSLLFVVYRLGTQSVTDTGAAIVDSESYFDGATVYDPPVELADFTLTGSDGEVFGLSDLRGKVTLIYFGYTHCPDVCPLTLNDFRQVKADMGDKADQVNFLMISVDGSRDTPERMGSFLSAFDETFLGMTGSEDEVLRAGADFGLYVQANLDEGENYTVDHTGSIFMVDREGFLRSVFTFGTEAEVIVEDVVALLAQ